MSITFCPRSASFCLEKLLSRHPLRDTTDLEITVFAADNPQIANVPSHAWGVFGGGGGRERERGLLKKTMGQRERERERGVY